MTVPASSPALSRHLAHLTVTPAVTTDVLQPLTIQFYLTVTQQQEETVAQPWCRLQSETYLQSCQPHLYPALSCQLASWSAVISLSAPLTGLQAGTFSISLATTL